MSEFGQYALNTLLEAPHKFEPSECGNRKKKIPDSFAAGFPAVEFCYELKIANLYLQDF
jgi:hypothetical protein